MSAPLPGTYTVQMTFGSVVQTMTFRVVQHQYQIKVLSVPANGSATGVVAAQPFSVQVVLDDGVTPAPISGQSIVIGGQTGAVLMTNCMYSACEIWVGNDATATAWIIPQQPGPLTLSASHAPLLATATFTAVGGVRTMKVVSQPGAGGALYGALTEVDVEVVSPDRTTPVGGDPVAFTVVSGPFALYNSTSSFSYTTGGDGIARGLGYATGYGSVVLQASDGYVSTLISFTAGTPPHVIKLVSTPSSPSTTGSPTLKPFTVQVFAQDGVTPAAGEAVTFTPHHGRGSLRRMCRSHNPMHCDNQRAGVWPRSR